MHERKVPNRKDAATGCVLRKFSLDGWSLYLAALRHVLAADEEDLVAAGAADQNVADEVAALAVQGVGVVRVLAVAAVAVDGPGERVPGDQSITSTTSAAISIALLLAACLASYSGGGFMISQSLKASWPSTK